MQSSLPVWLNQYIEEQLHGVSGSELARAYAALSEAYRSGKATPEGSVDEHHFWLAYLVGRMPATFAAVTSALSQAPAELLGGCESALDLGAGPGTALWAANAWLQRSIPAVAIERNPAAIALGQNLAAAAGARVSWQQDELLQGVAEAVSSDLVMAAYALGELEPGQRGEAVLTAFARAKKLFVMVEPGTPRGFEAILQARRLLIEGRAQILAPCPGNMACPMAPLQPARWCHFSQRLERGRMARQLKGGELGYEDEKFIYLIAAREGAAAPARLVGQPRHKGKSMHVELCTPSGLQELSLFKSNKDDFKRAKKADWGDAWP